MPEVVAKIALDYPPGTPRSPGERFHVEPQHAKLLALVGRVELVGPSETPPATATRSMQAATPASTYRTRDMAAETAKAPKPKRTRNREPILGRGRAA